LIKDRSSGSVKPHMFCGKLLKLVTRHYEHYPGATCCP